MKLWHSFIKELKLSSKSFYFLIELVMAFILLVVVLFIVPENFSSKSTEYISLDLPDEIIEMMEDELDVESEIKTFKIDDRKVETKYYETEDKKIYLIDNKEDMIELTKSKRPLVGAHISMDESGQINYEYYLQGYESEKLRNLYSVVHTKDADILTELAENQDIRSLENDYIMLSDRENILPSMLVLNGSIMSMFIIAAYIFLDKKEGIIKAYAVTASPVWHYLMSKVGVVLVTSFITSLIIVIPVMGSRPNYLIMSLLLVTSGFCIASIGLFIASFYENIMQAFGAIYIALILLMLPMLAYNIPSWEPMWIKLIPTYPLIQGFKESLLSSGDIKYTLIVSSGFLVCGVIVFLISNYRYKKTLTA